MANKFRPLFVILALAAILTIDAVLTSPLDCRRFVFAPACRGATIKRSFSPARKHSMETTNSNRKTSQCNDKTNADSKVFEIPAQISESEYRQLANPLKELQNRNFLIEKFAKMATARLNKADYSNEEPTEQIY